MRAALADRARVREKSAMTRDQNRTTTAIVIAGTVILSRTRFVEYLMDEHGWPHDKAAEHFEYATDALRSNEDILESLLADYPRLLPEEALAMLWFSGL
jgi:hypothetical protein